MIYSKPEISVLGDAALVIEDGTKAVPGNGEFLVPGWMLLPTYDLDQ